MSMFFGGTAQGPGRATQLSQTGSRSDVLGRQYQAFSNPFFDLASTYTPPTIKALFGFCRFFHLTHGVIHAVNTKASEYPVTDLLLSHKDSGVQRRWEELMHGVLNYRTHQVEVNLDYFIYGNAFVSPSYPFVKYLKCKLCGAEEQATKCRANWRYNNHGFWLSCLKCGQTDWASATDRYYPRLGDINLQRWNPEFVSLFANEATGRCDYTLDFSAEFRNGITMGRKDLVATTPNAILDAVRLQRTIVFDSNSVFHLRRPGPSQMMHRWGVPLMMPILKDAYYMQIMKKAQEAVLLQHLVPQILLFPQPATAGADPFCVTPDTLVEVPGGVLPASEIRTGDFLRSHTGVWRQVEDVIRRAVPSEERVYCVTPYTLAGFPFKVSEEHPILAVKNPQVRAGRTFDKTFIAEPTFIEAEKLDTGDFVVYPVKRLLSPGVVHLDTGTLLPERATTEDWVYLRYDPQGAEIYEYFEQHGIPEFKSGPTAELRTFLEQQGWDRKQYESVRTSFQTNDATRVPRYLTLDRSWMRIFGYFLAEGSTSDHAVAFAFHEKELSFIDELCVALTAKGYEPKRYPAEENSVTNVVVHDTLLAEMLRSLLGRYAAEKRIPQLVAAASDNLVAELLRCLFNGDGTILQADQKGTLRVSLKTCSPHLALEARRLALSMGYIGGVSRAVPKAGETAKAPYYQTYFNGAEACRIAALFGWTAPDVSTARPERNAFIRGDYLYMRIRSIDVVEEPEVLGFQMATDRTFCVAGVATHNTTVNLVDWRDHIRRELARQRMDPSYYGILPFPLGHQVIGENGKSLMLMPEIQSMAEHIVVGMGFPVDLIFGNGTYAGSSVNMRMLENSFMGNINSHMRLVHWVIKHFATFLGLPRCDARFKAFRMADDTQRMQLLMQARATGDVSQTSMLSQMDLKPEDEAALQLKELTINAELMKRRAELQAAIHGRQGVIMAKEQARAQVTSQNAMALETMSKKSPFDQSMQSGVNGPQGVTLDAVAAALAREVAAMPPERAATWLRQLRSAVPEMAQLVAEQQGAGLPAVPGDPAADAAAPQGGSSQPPGAPGAVGPINMQPMPEVLPPRRPGGV
jgi:hypothetical protein